MAYPAGSKCPNQDWEKGGLVPGELTPAIKKQIDAMSRFEMARKWRSAAVGDLFLQGAVGEYFSKRFKELGGFSPAISKALGW